MPQCQTGTEKTGTQVTGVEKASEQKRRQEDRVDTDDSVSRKASIVTKSPQPESAPYWLLPDAQEFWNSVVKGEKKLTRGISIMRYGPEVRVSVTINRTKTEYKTKKQVIWIDCEPSGRIVLEAFQYYPSDAKAYKKLGGNVAAWIQTAEEWNQTMYWFVEKNKISPEKSREKAKSLAKNVQRLLLLLTAESLVGP
jgi:hypothetical protein